METRVVTLEKALARAEQIAKTMGFDARETDVLKLLSASCKPIEDGGIVYLAVGEVEAFISNFQKAYKTKDSSFLYQKRGLCVDKVVGIEEFCESPEYMNQGGHIWPAVKKKLLEFFEGEYVEGVLTGGIGVGKNFFADFALARMIYELSCFHNPQLEFDLAPGSSIVFIQQSKTYTLAKSVVFEQFGERLKLSPYFRNIFPFDPLVKSTLRFPKHISVLPVGGSDTSAIGMNVYGGIIDELNFMARVQDSVET
ncbi:unnamed protein product, partial [marine sediment metagenome]